MQRLMKFLNLNRRRSLCCLLLASLLCACTKNVDEIRWGKSYGFIQILNVHSSPTKWLSAKGRRFENVQGGEPYYLEIPQLKLIFFVTSDDRRSRFDYHFLSLETGEDIKISAEYGYSSLGAGINAASDSKIVSRIAEVEWPKVVIDNSDYADRKRYEFNLKSLTVNVNPTSQPKHGEDQRAKE
jgi:hypothetical protein